MSNEYWTDATLRLTSAQLARLEAAGWVPGSGGALEEWVVARAEEAARKPRKRTPEERALAAGWRRDGTYSWGIYGWENAAGLTVSGVSCGTGFYWHNGRRYDCNPWDALSFALDAAGVPR